MKKKHGGKLERIIRESLVEEKTRKKREKKEKGRERGEGEIVEIKVQIFKGGGVRD